MKRIVMVGVIATAIGCAVGAASYAGRAGSREAAPAGASGRVSWDRRPAVHAAAAQAVSPTLGGIPLVDVWGGSARAVAGEGSIGYVAGWRYIEAIDLAADPPRTLGRLLVDDPISAIAVRAGRLYVASGRTLILFDVSRPARPSEIGRLELPPPAPEFWRRWIVRIAPGDGAIWLDVAAQKAGELPVHALVALDESLPTQLRRIADVPIGRPREVFGLWRVDDRLIVATVTTGGGIPFVTHVGSLDVRDPAAARWVGEAGPFNTFAGAAMHGEHLYLAATSSGQLPERSPDQTKGIRVLDVTAEGGPKLVGRWDADGDLYGIAVVGETAFVSLSDTNELPPFRCAVAVFDIRTVLPTERSRRPCDSMPPVSVAGYGFGDRWLTTVGGWGAAFFFFGRADPTRWEAWSATGDAALLLARGDAAHAAIEVAADAGRLFVFDGVAARLLEPAGGRWRERIVAADVGNDFPNLSMDDTAIALSGDTAIVAGSAGLIVFDVSATPARRVSDLSWSELGAEAISFGTVAVIGDKAVLGLDAPGFGFTLLNLADPAHPTRTVTQWDGIEITDLAVDGSRLYVLSRDHLYIFVPGGEHGLRLAGEWIAEGWQSDQIRVAALGDRAALGGGGFLQVLDVHDPAAIRVVAERHDDDLADLAFIGEDIVGVAMHTDRGIAENGLLYVRGDDASVIVWRPRAPFEANLAVIGDRLYVASVDEGLLEYRPWRLPDGWRADDRLALPWVAP